MMEKSPLNKPTVPSSAVKTNPVSPKKLLLSKWTAIKPASKEKHFLVVGVIQPEIPGAPVVEIDLEAAMTGRVMRMNWRALKDAETWLRGWV
jgi:tryptophan-rich hypothetical protein